MSRFWHGARRQRPICWLQVPSWDLALVLGVLAEAPFEPLESVCEKMLTLKITLLLALTTLKRVGDLQVLSVAFSCLEFAPGDVKVILHP